MFSWVRHRTPLVVLTIAPLVMLVLGSFMTRIDYFVLGFTLDHWKLILSDPLFLDAARTTCYSGCTSLLSEPAPLLSDCVHPGANVAAVALGLDLMVWEPQPYLNSFRD